MAEQASNSVRSLATDSYNQAARLFVNRDFAACYEQLRPLLDRANSLLTTNQISRPTLTKMLVLYVTLCDTAFSRLEEHGLTVKTRRSLQEAVLKGTLWEQAASAFGSTASVPPTLIVAVINVTFKHNGDFKVAQEFIERYMSLISPEELSDADLGNYRLMIEAFAKQVLAANGEFLYAREIVNNSNVFSTGQRLKVVAELEVSEKKYKEEQARQEAARREHERQEEARVAKAIEDERTAAEIAARVADVPAEEIEKCNETNRPVARQPRQSLPAYWRDVFKQYLRRHGFMNAVLLVLLLVSATTNRQARDRLSNGTKWLWAAAKQSAAMVFTVTYL